MIPAHAGYEFLVDIPSTWVRSGAPVRLRVYPLPYKTMLRVLPGFPGRHIYVSMVVPDILTGESREVHAMRTVEEFRDSQHVALFVRDVLRELLMHEVDEAIVVNGVRVFDPHASEKASDEHSAVAKKL